MMLFSSCSPPSEEVCFDDLDLFALPEQQTEYIGCDSILAATPKGGTLHAFKNVKFELKQIDPRWEGLTLEIFWDPVPQDKGRIMGLKGFAVDGASDGEQYIDVTNMLTLEAFTCDETSSPAYGELFKEIHFQDMNMDTYLDISFTAEKNRSQTTTKKTA